MSGLWQLHFKQVPPVYIESGYGVRQLAYCFKAKEGEGDLLEKITGKEIVFSCDPMMPFVRILAAFTPVEDWHYDMPELGETLWIEVEEEDE